MKILLSFLSIIFLSGVIRSDQNQTPTQRNYCTEFGIFNLVFDDDEVAGAYALNFKNALGAVWGKLEGRKMNGRWVDADGKGEIILYFNEDLSYFTANYRSDAAPEQWYKDSWHGALKPDGQVQFTKNQIQFKCK